MGQLIVEHSVAVVCDQPVDVVLVCASNAKWRFEIFARKRETVDPIVRRADDYKEGRVGSLEDFLEAPCERRSAALVVNMGDESRDQLAVRFLASGKAWSA